MRILKSYEVSELLKKTRVRKFPSQKEFWKRHQLQLNISYPHFSAVENSKKFPSIELVVAISKILNIDLRYACHLWAADQMPDSLTRSFFGPNVGHDTSAPSSLNSIHIEEHYIFNAGQIHFLLKQPKTWLVINQVISFQEIFTVTRSTIAKNLDLNERELDHILDWCIGQGVLCEKNGRITSACPWVHLPNNRDFKEIRNNNFLDTANELVRKISFEDIHKNEAYRTTMRRTLSRVQAQEIRNRVGDLVNHMARMELMGDEQYALAVALGPICKMD